MQNRIVEGDDFSVLPPVLVRLARRVRKVFERDSAPPSEPENPTPSDDEPQ